VSTWVIRDFHTVERVAEKLQAHGERANDMFGVMTKIALDMLEAERKLFESQGRRGGGSWKPLKPDTIRRKGHNRILVRSGMLKASLTELGAPFQVMDITNTTIRFGTDDPIGLVHEMGLGTVPRRPIIKFGSFDNKRWNNWIIEHLMRGMA
jgi:phage gpG-like protein